MHHSSSFHHRHHHHHRHNLPGQALDIAIREQMSTMIIMMMVTMMIIMMMTNHFSLQSWWASGSKACWVTNCWSVLTNQHIGSGCLGFSDTDSHNFSLVAQLSRPPKSASEIRPPQLSDTDPDPWSFSTMVESKSRQPSSEIAGGLLQLLPHRIRIRGHTVYLL